MSIFLRISQTPGEWLNSSGPFSDIVLSCRIRLARNIDKIKFPEYMNENESSEVKSDLKNVINLCPSLVSPEFYEMSELTPAERLILIERHLISKQLANKKEGMLILQNDERLSIMINEEDHLRIQSIDSGLRLFENWEIINKLDQQLETQINYAFSNEFGYLTACPTNVGTGMRCSILVHLPGIIMINQLNKINSAIEKLGLTIRGYYGEGTESIGNFFQISNQITIGKTEEKIIEKIDNIARQIVEHEKNARRILMQESKVRVEDQIFRAYGILKNARIISSNETMALLSMIRLGVDLEIIKNISIKTINEILVYLQPGHLQKLFLKDLNAEKRDIKRAEMIREKFLVD
ncbi:protein arginine kinase [Candidatus Dependentiae bacterium]|nr:protein arginine kinase [Candidatus Dependentiae bacterium]